MKSPAAIAVPHSADAGSIDAAIEALRARGAPRLVPVRLQFLQALARRAGGHQGATRQHIEARLQQALVEVSQALDAAIAQQAAKAATAPTQPPGRSALAALLAHMAQHTGDAPPGVVDGPGTAANGAPPELRALRQHRETWARLRVDQRLNQSLATVPDQAGPLNTQRLLHEALSVMREASPAYLHQFMTHVETLLWLEHAHPVDVAERKAPVRSPRARRPAGLPPR